MIGSIFSYQRRLEKYLDREVKLATGRRWIDAHPGTPNRELLGPFTFGQVCTLFDHDKRPIPAAALLVVTGAAADNLVNIADHVTSEFWSEDTDPSYSKRLVERYDISVRTGIRMKESVDPFGGEQEFLRVVRNVALKTASFRYSFRDFSKVLNAARAGVPFPADAIEGYDDENEVAV